MGNFCWSTIWTRKIKRTAAIYLFRTVTKVQHTDTKEWSFISTIRVRDSLIQNYKERGKLEELQNELILDITKEVNEKLI